MTWLPWNAHQDRLRDEVMLQAQRLVTQAAGSKDNIEQAKRSAELILQMLFEHVGWNVRVVWQDNSSAHGTTDAKSQATAGSRH